MASATYAKAKSTIAPYLGEEKAQTCIDRQLERCSASPDSFSDADLKTILNFLVGASTIHLAPDQAKIKELTDKIRALVC